MGDRVNSQALRRLLQLGQGTVDRLRRYDAGMRAAALAYYTLLSLFPLLLLLMNILSQWLTAGQAIEAVLSLVRRVAPIVPPELATTLRNVLAARGPANIVATLALLWSASNLFAAMTSALDRFWSGETGRAFWEHRLLSIGLVLGVVIMFLLSSLLGLVLSILPRLIALLLPIRMELLWWGWRYLPPVLMLATDVVLYALLYRFIPSRAAPWPAVWAGAICAGLGWNVMKIAFGWYVTRFARYGLVYGTLASLVAFLVWVYLSGLVLLLGAALGATWAEVWTEEERGLAGASSHRYNAKGESIRGGVRDHRR